MIFRERERKGKKCPIDEIKIETEKKMARVIKEVYIIHRDRQTDREVGMPQKNKRK